MSKSKRKWAKDQLTEKQAIEMCNSRICESWDAEKVVRFQLFQQRLCMEFSTFQKCMEEVLNRPVFTHEFAKRDNLVMEYLGEKETPTLEEIINLIPEEKRIVLNI